MENSINYNAGKIKGWATSHKQEIFTSLIIIFVGSASFGAGVLSTKTGHPPIEIRQSGAVENTDLKASVAPVPIFQPASVVPAVTNIVPKAQVKGDITSRNGVAYYLSHCNSSRILDKNKIYFKTEAEAQSAGYHLAGNCKR